MGHQAHRDHPTGEYFQFSFFFRVHLTIPAEGIGPDPDRRNGSFTFLHDGMVLFDQRPSSLDDGCVGRGPADVGNHEILQTGQAAGTNHTGGRS